MFNKYLKYKNKYLDLKNMIGGGKCRLCDCLSSGFGCKCSPHHKHSIGGVIPKYEKEPSAHPILGVIPKYEKEPSAHPILGVYPKHKGKLPPRSGLDAIPSYKQEPQAHFELSDPRQKFPVHYVVDDDPKRHFKLRLASKILMLLEVNASVRETYNYDKLLEKIKTKFSFNQSMADRLISKTSDLFTQIADVSVREKGTLCVNLLRIINIYDEYMPRYAKLPGIIEINDNLIIKLIYYSIIFQYPMQKSIQEASAAASGPVDPALEKIYEGYTDKELTNEALRFIELAKLFRKHGKPLSYGRLTLIANILTERKSEEPILSWEHILYGESEPNTIEQDKLIRDNQDFLNSLLPDEKKLTEIYDYQYIDYRPPVDISYKAPIIYSVTIPNFVKRIGKYAFSSITPLTHVSWPESLIQIDDGAFRHTNVDNTTVPKSVRLGENVFVNFGLI